MLTLCSQVATLLRIDYGPGYRIYFTKRGHELVVLLAGGDKSTQAGDIKTASHRLRLQAVPPTAERTALLTLVVPEEAFAVATQLRSGTTEWRELVGKLKGSPNFNDDLVDWPRTMRHCDFNT